MDDSETQSGPRWRPQFYGPLSLAFVILCTVVAHMSLLRVPWFWDETYFAGAARDLFLSGNLVPRSVAPESHPPLVYVWLSVWWKLFGFGVPVARVAMLAVSAITLAAVYRLARLFTVGAVPIVATILTAAYPVFFVESTLVTLDMSAAALTLWALVAHLEGRRWGSALLFSLAVLAKETAIVAPLAVLTLEVAFAIRDGKLTLGASARPVWKKSMSLLAPLFVLLLWFAWLHHASGATFGESHYVRDNLYDALHPTRMLLACVRNIWHLAAYLNLYILTGSAAVICAIRQRPRGHRPPAQRSRDRLVLAGVVIAYVFEHSVVGAVLAARYLLPVYPLVILALVAAIASRVRWWPAVAAVTAVAFIIALLPGRNWILFRRDDSLAYLDYVALHQSAGEFLASNCKESCKVATMYPASAQLSLPWLGYTSHPLKVLTIDSFTPAELIRAIQAQPEYILLYPRLPCRVTNSFSQAGWLHGRYFTAMGDIKPDEAARLTNSRVVFQAQRHCDWVAVLKVVGADTAMQGQSVTAKTSLSR